MYIYSYDVSANIISSYKSAVFRWESFFCLRTINTCNILYIFKKSYPSDRFRYPMRNIFHSKINTVEWNRLISVLSVRADFMDL